MNLDMARSLIDDTRTGATTTFAIRDVFVKGLNDDGLWALRVALEEAPELWHGHNLAADLRNLLTTVKCVQSRRQWQGELRSGILCSSI
jgi:hypothetical protein